jgi:hypothetical protein
VGPSWDASKNWKRESLDEIGINTKGFNLEVHLRAFRMLGEY